MLDWLYLKSSQVGTSHPQDYTTLLVHILDSAGSNMEDFKTTYTIDRAVHTYKLSG